ncbi:uncharacterized protein LOC129243544 [Anastrepha obliqua]|uniref:uncharacterized protein LOC129243544 n=1 Tax=Anastrepha obliqua TaxID=95512 RepID=UPI00240A8D3F|nr:uncharacterized protein LOC129243544 [Anastrepha obliqua]
MPNHAAVAKPMGDWIEWQMDGKANSYNRQTDLKELRETKQFILRPLSASEVYQLLASTGRSDAIPDGRFVRQGLTFVDKFRRRIIGGGNEVRTSRQQVCFETRSARNLAEAEAVFGAYVAASNRREDESLKKRVRNSEVARILKLKKRKKLRTEDVGRGKKRIQNDDDEPISNPDLVSRTATVGADDNLESLTLDPATKAVLVMNTDATVMTNPAVEMYRDAEDAAISTRKSSTPPEGAINCIFIRKNE